MNKRKKVVESSVADPEQHHFGKRDPDQHQSGKLDPDLHQQDPDPHQSENVEVLEGHFAALEGPNLEKSEWQDPDTDPNQIERQDPDQDAHQSESQDPDQHESEKHDPDPQECDADPQHWLKVVIFRRFGGPNKKRKPCVNRICKNPEEVSSAPVQQLLNGADVEIGDSGIVNAFAEFFFDNGADSFLFRL